MNSTTWDSTTGRPAGPPLWPLAGGELMQPERLAEAVELLRVEWDHLPRPKREAEEKRNADAEKRRR